MNPFLSIKIKVVGQVQIKGDPVLFQRFKPARRRHPRARSTKAPPAARSAACTPGTPPTRPTTSARPADPDPSRSPRVQDVPGPSVVAVVVTWNRRELLQESTTLKTIKKQVTKRVLDLLDEIATDKPDDYKAVWSSFGRILKEGLAVDPDWKERIAKLTRWPTTAGEELVSLGVQDKDIDLVMVPGALEIPLALQAFAEKGGYDALVAIGCVIRGETYHFELVCNESAAGVTRVGLDYQLPIANAVITTENVEQAIARQVEKGRDAARVAVEMANLLERLG